MKSDSIAIVNCNVKVLQTGTIFQQSNQKITINAPTVLMRSLVDLCDGNLTKAEIITKLSIEWDQEDVSSLVDELCNLGLIVDPKYMCESMWKFATNPSPYAKAVTDEEAADLADAAWGRHKSKTAGRYYPKSTFEFGNLLEDRHSVRDFSSMPVQLQTIVGVLWSGYGECRDSKRTVP